MQSKKQWNITTKPIRGSTVYIAFPGMGKTTYALHHAGVVDMDFGSFRSAMGVAPARQATLYDPFIKLCNTFTKGGFTVLTNEPGLIPFFKQCGYVIVVNLPSDVEDIIKRVLERGSNPAFDREYSKMAPKWVEDWKKIAEKYGAKILFSKYFSILKGGDDDENRKN